jgi:hypothetical protein
MIANENFDFPNTARTKNCYTLVSPQKNEHENYRNDE